MSVSKHPSKIFLQVWGSTSLVCGVLILKQHLSLSGEDYSIASSDVVLLEGETTKAVPIYIIDDIYPELEEAFLVQLLNETTGGASLGPLREAVITIDASDDPFGLFGNQTNFFFPFI